MKNFHALQLRRAFKNYVGDWTIEGNEVVQKSLMEGCALVFAMTYILLNLLADIVTIISNPRLLHPR